MGVSTAAMVTNTQPEGTVEKKKESECSANAGSNTCYIAGAWNLTQPL